MDSRICIYAKHRDQTKVESLRSSIQGLAQQKSAAHAKSQQKVQHEQRQHKFDVGGPRRVATFDLKVVCLFGLETFFYTFSAAAISIHLYLAAFLWRISAATSTDLLGIYHTRNLSERGRF